MDFVSGGESVKEVREEQEGFVFAVVFVKLNGSKNFLVGNGWCEKEREEFEQERERQSGDGFGSQVGEECGRCFF